MDDQFAFRQRHVTKEELESEYPVQIFADEVSVELSQAQARLAAKLDETLRDRAARETAEGVGRKCFDQPLLKALGVPEYDFEDEAQALRSKALEDMRGSA